MKHIYPNTKGGKYPGYIILADGEIIDSGDHNDNCIVYGENDDQNCVARAIAILGLKGVSCVEIKKVRIIEWEEDWQEKNDI